MASWQKAGRDTSTPHWLQLEEEFDSKKLYSPVYTFVGQVSELAERVEVIHVHE
jgi:hypothetical protein